MFKVGDKVECLEPGLQSLITFGNKYVISDISRDLITIINDSGFKQSYFPFRFKLCKSSTSGRKQWRVNGKSFGDKNVATQEFANLKNINETVLLEEIETKAIVLDSYTRSETIFEVHGKYDIHPHKWSYINTYYDLESAKETFNNLHVCPGVNYRIVQILERK